VYVTAGDLQKCSSFDNVREITRYMLVPIQPIAYFTDNGTFRIPLLFSGLRRFLYFVRKGAGRRAELCKMPMNLEIRLQHSLHAIYNLTL